jgi:DNA-binding transcriptional LysR family regulator
MDAPNRIERRLKLRDLTVMAAVARLGSMGRAAAALNTSQPAISRSIAELEQALGVRLLERDRRGVRVTEYGLALLKCHTAVFDALREGIKNIESLADPTIGEVRIGSISPMTAHLLPTAFNHLARQYPGAWHLHSCGRNAHDRSTVPRAARAQCGSGARTHRSVIRG